MASAGLGDLPSVFSPQLYIYWGSESYLLFQRYFRITINHFPSIYVENWFQLLLGCIVTFLLAFSVPILQHYKGEYFAKKESEHDCCSSDSEKVNKSDVRIVLTGIYFVQTIIGTLLMLLWMSYNGWIILASCLGAALGYYLYESSNDDGSQITKCCA